MGRETFDACPGRVGGDPRVAVEEEEGALGAEPSRLLADDHICILIFAHTHTHTHTHIYILLYIYIYIYIGLMGEG